MEWLTALGMTALSATFAAGGAYVAVRVELRFLWRDLERLIDRVASLEAPGAPRRRRSDHPSRGRGPW